MASTTETVSSARAFGPALPRPDAITLACFAGVILITGANPTVVKISYRDLAPFWGAGLRFVAGSLILFAVAAIMRIPLPRGRALAGAVLFGLIACFGAYAFIYVALQHLHASIASPVMACVPLITFFLAIAHRVEKFRWRGLIGGLTSVVGIVVLSGVGSHGGGPVKYILFIVAASVCASEAGIVVKKFPAVHPIMMNAVAMAVAGPLFLAGSFLGGERHTLPQHTDTWASLVYLILLGSVAMFILYVVIVKRWTVTGASYQFVLFPIVAVLIAAWLGNESITASLGIGAALVLAGVYIGALSGQHKRTVAHESDPAPCTPPC